jgi:hypothetical protein
MTLTTRRCAPLLLAVGLVVAACGGGGAEGSDEVGAAATDAVAEDAAAVATDVTAANGGAPAAAGVMALGGEDITIDGLRCFFEEQPRAGLGGVFTHTAQGQGTNAEDEAVILDLSRARAEDGTVGDQISVDIGDPLGDESVSLGAGGPEGLILFGEDRVAASDVEVSEFGAEPVTLTFDLACR